MTEIRFGRDQHGAVTVLVPDGYEPIDELLSDDVTDDREMLAEILDHARNPTREEWGTGGNACWVSITPDAVTVDNEYSGQTTTLPHAEFIEIVEAYRRELDATEADR